MTLVLPMPHHRRFSLALLLGAVLGLCFPKCGGFWLAWLVPGLFLMLGAGQPGRITFRVGFYAGLGNFLCSLYWLLLVPMKLQAVAAWLALSVYLALFYGGWCWLCWRVAPPEQEWGRVGWPRRALWGLFCAVAWAAMEFTLGRLWGGFPWNALGSSQYRLLPLIQIASVTGVGAISLLVVWVSVSVWRTALAAWPGPLKLSRLGPELAPPVIALAGVLGFGFVRLAAPEAPAARLKVALVQPAIPQSILWDVRERTNRLSKLCELSHAALAQHPDLLVWPEAALPPVLVGRTRETQDLITSLVRTGNVWMVFGGIDTAPRRDGPGDLYRFNAAFFIDPAGDLISRYFKRHLVVFGEYMPALRWLPFLRYLRQSGSGLEAGRRPVTFQMKRPAARISPLICYEDVFPSETRESVDGETDFLLNLTNNGWFGASAAQWQHAVCALFRAVENGVPLVRCTNNGLTCWIDARGRLHDVYWPGSRDIYGAGYKLVEVPLRAVANHGRRTIFNRYGDCFGWSCAGIVLAVLGWSFRPKQAHGRKQPAPSRKRTPRAAAG
jgi:apolipoprotein N-acyltransferase